jgi:hypothetical protein|tara:strand:- start:10 stop:315 length:306 start_codon:yes stop_codon:yes gene_type:complete
MATKIKWDEANFKWNDNPHTWDDVALVIEVISVVGPPGEGDDFIHPIFDKEPEKKKKLVKLICKVQGKTIKKEKEIKEYKITVKDIQLLAEEVLGINVKVL